MTTHQTPTRRTQVEIYWPKPLGVIICLGLALLTTWSQDIYTNDLIYPPSVGIVLIIIGSLLYVSLIWREIRFGDWRLYVPLLVIAVSIALSGILNGRAISDATVALGMVALFLFAQREAKALSKFFMWFTIASAAGVVAFQVVNPGVRTGGYLVSVNNYNLIIGVLVLGTLLSPERHRWWLSAVSGAGMLLTGSDEGLFVGAVLVVTMLVKRDWGMKILLPVTVIGIVAVICTLTGVTQKLYQTTVERVDAVSEAAGSTTDRNSQLLVATGYRIGGNWKLDPLRPFGYGYDMTPHNNAVPHNVALVVIQQSGVLAVLAWVAVVVYLGAVRKKWYLVVAMLALGVFDCFIWTQMLPWWIVAVGVTTTPRTNS